MSKQFLEPGFNFQLNWQTGREETDEKRGEGDKRQHKHVGEKESISNNAK